MIDNYDISPIINTLYDTEIEVRKVAGNSLSILASLFSQERLKEIISNLKNVIQTNTQENYNLPVVHGAVLGLIGIIKGFDTEIPSWLPDLLDYLRKYKNGYGIISDSIRLCLSDFSKYHKPVWTYIKDKFTEEQQQDLYDYINPYNDFA